MGLKRTRDGEMADGKKETIATSASPYLPMFEGFRQDLDEHHDRRERIIKASRDITAASKKIIFTLQRIRTVGEPLPAFAHKSNAQYWTTINTQYKTIIKDLQGLNAHRYAHNITGGNQEFMEALSFQHYLETQSLVTFGGAQAAIIEMTGGQETVGLTPEDYVLGICDMTGELMRFAVTSMATSGKVPAAQNNAAKKFKKPVEQEEATDKMDVDEPASTSEESAKPRTVLDDLRAIRRQLEMLDVPNGPKFAYELQEKKMPVLRECVDKVEKALYGLTVRGSERPKGWMPDVGGGVVVDRRAEFESC